MRPRGEQGMALLMVLVLVAVMSALAVGILEDVRFAVRRTANAQSVGQARWYALGAEGLARAQLARLAKLDPERTTLRGDWNDKVFRFPIENGTLQGRVMDGTGCFNLNSVVQGQGEQLQARVLGGAQFQALAVALGAPQREAELLAAALTDWIDSDVVRERGGAEDEAYARGSKPYRTAGALMAEVSELRAVRGVTPELYARLRPLLCALPTADLSPINVNTLGSDRAVLITMLTDGAVSLDAARQALARRPPGGWSSIDSFWRDEALADAAPGGEAYQQVQMRTRFFNLETEVVFGDAEVVSSALFEQDAAGDVRLVARRWTRDE